ncbi:hypothetical protein JCM5353_005933 [Sporobolomyces roseus]
MPRGRPLPPGSHRLHVFTAPLRPDERPAPGSQDDIVDKILKFWKFWRGHIGDLPRDVASSSKPNIHRGPLTEYEARYYNIKAIYNVSGFVEHGCYSPLNVANENDNLIAAILAAESWLQLPGRGDVHEERQKGSPSTPLISVLRLTVATDANTTRSVLVVFRIVDNKDGTFRPWGTGVRRASLLLQQLETRDAGNWIAHRSQGSPRTSALDSSPSPSSPSCPGGSWSRLQQTSFSESFVSRTSRRVTKTLSPNLFLLVSTIPRETSSEPYDPYIPGSNPNAPGGGPGPSGGGSGAKAPGDARTQAIQAQIDDTVGIMRDNINKVAERGERLDALQDKTDTLAQSAQGFRKGANRVRKRMWWKDMKMRMLIAAGIAILVIIIVVPIVVKK